MSNLLEVADLTVRFPLRQGALRRHVGDLVAVDRVSFSVAKGSTLGLVGESGSGKTTTGRAILRLVEPTSGSVSFGGHELTKLSQREMRQMRSRLQIVFQDPYGSLNPRRSVGEVLSAVVALHAGTGRDDSASRSAELLSTVGLPASYMSRYPHQLSGGQRQRVSIARALAASPEFIVCDEPISALDVSIQAQILNLLIDLRSRLGLTYLFVAHDLAVVRHLSDVVAVMYLGRLVEIGPPAAIFGRSGHPYTRALLSAAPLPDPYLERKRKRVVLEGDLPSPSAAPQGCNFHTRCWLYKRLGSPTACREVEPNLALIAGDHSTACHFSAEAQESGVGGF